MRISIPPAISLKVNGPLAVLRGGLAFAAIGEALAIEKFLQVGETITVVSYPCFGFTLGMLGTVALSVLTGNAPNPFSRRFLRKFNNAPIGRQRAGIFVLAFPFAILAGSLYDVMLHIRNAHNTAVGVIIGSIVLAIALPEVLKRLLSYKPSTPEPRHTDETGRYTPASLIADAERREALRNAAEAAEQAPDSYNSTVAIAPKEFNMSEEETLRLQALTDHDASTARTSRDHLDDSGALIVPDLEYDLVEVPKQ